MPCSQAVAGLVAHFAWKYVSIIYKDDDFGRSGRNDVGQSLGVPCM